MPESGRDTPKNHLRDSRCAIFAFEVNLRTLRYAMSMTCTRTGFSPAPTIRTAAPWVRATLGGGVDALVREAHALAS